MNLLCLDVVIGALLSGGFAASVTGVSLSQTYWVVLGMSVWALYNLDHLVDAYRLGERATTARHLFVHRNFRRLSVAVMLVMIAAVFLVIRYHETRMLLFGIVAGLVSVAYFTAIHMTRGRKAFLLKKEIIVAAIYSAGIWGIPLMYVPGRITFILLASVGGFFLLALSNTLLLSVLDVDTDKADGHPTFATLYGVKNTKLALYGAAGTVLAVAAGLMISSDGILSLATGLIYLLMAVTMIGISLLKPPAKRRILIRILVEIVFWFPGLILFC